MTTIENVAGASESLYIEIGDSSSDNTQELKFRNETQPIVEPKHWERRFTETAVLDLPLQLWRKGIRFRGNVLELGAGGCWFSSIVSKFVEVKHVYALDFSSQLLMNVAPLMMDHLHAKKEKIVRVRGSFYNLRVINKKFDFVVFDSALHHADHPIKLLREIREVLSNDGVLVCLRENIAPSLPILEQIVRRKTGASEKRYGVTENIFTLSQWKDLFRRGEFRMRVIALPISLNRKSLLMAQIPYLNKLLYRADSQTIAFVAVPY
jgi:SAM-dependent methyltransferase